VAVLQVVIIEKHRNEAKISTDIRGTQKLKKSRIEVGDKPSPFFSSFPIMLSGIGFCELKHVFLKIGTMERL